MNNIIDRIWALARKKERRIVLVEGEDERIQEAALKIQKDNLARPVLLGSPDKIRVKGVETIDPENDSRISSFKEDLASLIPEKEVESKVKNPLYFGSLLLRRGDVDGMVGGATNTTAETVRAALKIIGIKVKNSILSSFFLMIATSK